MKVVCFAGSIASGKSTLSKALSAATEGSAVCSFGSTVLRYAERECANPDRGTLQATGEWLIKRGWADFVGETIGQIDKSATSLLVIDGVRHLSALGEVRRQTHGSELFLVFVEAPHDVVMQRIDERGESVLDSSHSVESEVPQLKELADIVIDGSKPTGAAVSAILRHIGIGNGAQP